MFRKHFFLLGNFLNLFSISVIGIYSIGYVHTGPVPNGSNVKIVTDRPFVHTGPANRTRQSVPDQVRKLDLPKSRSSFGTVSVPNGSVTV